MRLRLIFQFTYVQYCMIIHLLSSFLHGAVRVTVYFVWRVSCMNHTLHFYLNLELFKSLDSEIHAGFGQDFITDPRVCPCASI